MKPKPALKLRPLTSGEKKIRQKYTSHDKYNNVWLIIDHQSFCLCPADYSNRTHKKEARVYALWRRRQLAIALARMVTNINSESVFSAEFERAIA